MPNIRDPKGRFLPNGGRTPRPLVTVDLAPFQARWKQLHAEGLSMAGLARRMGWMHWKTDRGRKPTWVGDAQRARRALGLKSQTNRHGKRHQHQRCYYETALLLGRALQMDPYEWDT